MSRQVRTQPPPATADGRAVALLAGLVAAASVSTWADVGVAAVLAGRGWQDIPLASAPGLLARLVTGHHLGRALLPARLAAALPAVPLYYIGAAALLAVAAAGLLAAARRLAAATRPGRRRPAPAAPASGWATGRALAALSVRGATSGRVVLGRCGRRLVAAEERHSLLVVGPTQSGKTSGLVVPAILEWAGPVVATSVKGDLLHATEAARRGRGAVSVFDPAAVTGVGAAGWSPLGGAHSWAGARRVAAALCSVARAGGAGLEDGAFWYTLAEKLAAPLLYAGATAGAELLDVLRWVDTEEVAEVVGILEQSDEPAALQAFAASVGREDRARSSVYATLESVLAAYADPVVAASARAATIDPELFVRSGRSDTCYLLAPAHEQERLAPVFVAVLRGFLDAAFQLATQRRAPLDPPLLVVLDEAAHVAPLGGLDALAATAAAHGIQLVTVFQDYAQIEARYGVRAATVVNNHRAKVLCSGVSDTTTLERVSALIGEEEHWSEAHSVDGAGGWSRTASATARPLAPGDALRRLPPGEAVLLYGHLPPARIALRLAHRDRHLRRLAAAPGDDRRADARPAQSAQLSGRPPGADAAAGASFHP